MTAALTEWTDGLSARVVTGGGEGVLWVHGYTMDSSVWGDLWKRLPGWDHVGLDLPGHGGSRPIGPDEDLTQLALTVAEAATTRAIRHIVALSFGTVLAIEMLIRHPTAFTSVVLGAPSLVGGPHDPNVQDRYIALYRLYRQSGAGPHMRDHWMSCHDIFGRARADTGCWDSLRDAIGRHSWAELGDGSMLRLTGIGQDPRGLQAATAGTLIVLGEHEMPAFRACAEMVRQQVPDCEQVVLDGAGHLCLLEAPDRVAPLIEGHLRRPARAEAG